MNIVIHNWFRNMLVHDISFRMSMDRRIGFVKLRFVDVLSPLQALAQNRNSAGVSKMVMPGASRHFLLKARKRYE